MFVCFTRRRGIACECVYDDIWMCGMGISE